MARTLLAQTPVTLGGVDGIDFMSGAENPDVVNGNDVPFNSKHFYLIKNNHDAKYIGVIPVVQRTISEGGESLSIANPASIHIPFGEQRIIGPFSSTNFKKANNRLELNWAFEGGGDIAASDVEVVVIAHP